MDSAACAPALSPKRLGTGRILLWGIACAAFLAALVMQGLPTLRRKAQKPMHDTTLAVHLPVSLPGCTIRELPIADSTEMQQMIDDKLGFSDAVFREYRGQKMTFSVYVAYWRPGEASYREIARHVPDSCWVAAGWKLIAQESRKQIRMGQSEVVPGEHRVFASPGGDLQHVVYWHLVAGTPIHYAGGKTTTLRESKLYQKIAWFDQTEQQYFVRISSDVPTDQWAADGSFQAVWEKLAFLGLAKLQ